MKETLGLFDIDQSAPSLNYKERLSIYKECGFTHLAFYWDNDYLHYVTYLELLDYAKSIGLNVEHVHLDYKHSNDLSLDTIEGENYFSYLSEKLQECMVHNIHYVVVHASKGNDAINISTLGMERVAQLNEMLEQSNTYLCFENVRVNQNLFMILHLGLSHIKMCFDSGHAHCYSNEVALLTEYPSEIVTTHLHNNYGKDTHESLESGTINWETIFPLIEKTKRKVDYLEVFPEYEKTLSRQEFVQFVTNAREQYFKIKNMK